MVSFDLEHKLWKAGQYMTPLDEHWFTAFAFALENVTNKSTPITTFAVGDAGPGDFTTTYEMVPSTNQFTYDTGDGPITTGVGSYTTFAKVKHSTRARALTLSTLLINWVLTLCISAIVGHRRGVKDGVALLPITIILSIPAIRSLYVGSPPFGIFLGGYRNHSTPLQRIDAFP